MDKNRHQISYMIDILLYCNLPHFIESSLLDCVVK